MGADLQPLKIAKQQITIRAVPITVGDCRYGRHNTTQMNALVAPRANSKVVKSARISAHSTRHDIQLGLPANQLRPNKITGNQTHKGNVLNLALVHRAELNHCKAEWSV